MPPFGTRIGGRRPFATQMAPAIARLYVDARRGRPDRCPCPETKEQPGTNVAPSLGRAILVVEVSVEIRKILFPRGVPTRPGDDTVLA